MSDNDAFGQPMCGSSEAAVDREIADLRAQLAAVTAERDALKAELATLKQEHGPFVERGVYLSLKSNHRAAVAGSVSAKAQVEALKTECERKDEALTSATILLAPHEKLADGVPSEFTRQARDVLRRLRAALSPAQTKP